ncbi:putative zinc finger protein [Orchesella cincta]|uniref:Putative zinc finger protein n=1 Tax=Orchesella cincta TaxID=48709 RepID=A0A1D2M2A7_ORCCI|nr:putative zinc finger protein [Orchesella cincta]
MNAAKSHVISVHTRFYKCDLCERRFPYPAGLQKHLESTHKQGSTSYCPTCKKPFVGKKPSSNHLWTHYSEEEKQEALARGEKVPHTIVKRYQCENVRRASHAIGDEKTPAKGSRRSSQEKKICGVCGAAVVSLLAHMKQSHPKEEDFRFSCSVCDKKFAQYTRLKHQKRPFKCPKCPMAFTRAEVLRKHKLYKHEGVKCPPSRPRKKQKVVEVETSDSE